MSDIQANLIHAQDGPAPQHKVKGKEQFEASEGSDGATHTKIVDKLGEPIDPRNVKDKDVRAELQLIRATQKEILERLDEPLDTNARLTGSIDEKPLKVEVVGKRSVLNTPIGFDWINHPLKNRIFFNHDTQGFETDFDLSEMKINGEGNTYFVSPDGDDSNDGLSWETPLRTIYKAVDKDDALTVYVYEGIYKRLSGLWPSGHEDKNINIIGVGDVVLTTHDNLTYSLHEDSEHVYEASRSQVGSIIDSKFIDDFGDYEKLKKVDSLDVVEETPSTWYTDGSSIYVHTKDSRKPDDRIMPLLVTGNGFFKGNSKIYLEGLKFYGGRASIETSINNSEDKLHLYMKNCEAKYSNESHDGIRIRGCELTIFQDCLCAANGRDGFNYHEERDITPKTIEINCVGRHNGHTAQDNGSSAHDGVKAIRINGRHYDNQGPNIIDVNEGTQSWNLGVESAYSNHEDFMNPEVFSVGQNNGKTSMWLDRCVGYGANLRVGSESYLYHRDSKFEKGVIDGTIYKY